MRLFKATYILAAAALALSTSSCKDFLDTMPDTRVELNSVEKARMLLVDSYPSVHPGLIGELMSDNMEDNNTQDSKGNRYNLPSYARFDDELFAFEDVKSSTSDSDSPSKMWSGYYSAIAGANAALDCLDKLQERIDAGETVEDADKLPAVRAEALLIRAYSNFMLASYFCEAYRGPELSKSMQGLAYPTEPETTVMPHYERLDLATFFDLMEKDIQEALPMVSNAIYEVPKYHFNQAAAYAFAARFYLTKRDYKKVLEYCNRAFGGENADASQYMTDIWTKPGEFYYISDMGLYYNATEKAHNIMLVPTYSLLLRHFTGGKRYGYTRDGKRACMQGPGPTWEGFRWRNSSTGETFSMHPAVNGFCGSNGKIQYGSFFGPTCAEQFEYTNKIAGIGYPHQTFAVFTGEEVVLMRAEAKLFLGDKEGCLADLNVWELARRNTPNADGMDNYWKDLTETCIRNFYRGSKDPGFGIVKEIHLDEVTPSDTYSVTADIEPILQCIQHFRRIELVHTGMRFLDIKRYGIEITHKIGPENRYETLSLFDPRRAVQVPPEVVAAGFEPATRLDKDETSTLQGEFYTPAN